MTHDPKNTKNFGKKSDIFAEKFWENVLTYFQKFSAKKVLDLEKNGWLYKILEKSKTKKKKKKKKLTKCRIWVGRP